MGAGSCPVRSLKKPNTSEGKNTSAAQSGLWVIKCIAVNTTLVNRLATESGPIEPLTDVFVYQFLQQATKNHFLDQRIKHHRQQKLPGFQQRPAPLYERLLNKIEYQPEEQTTR